MVFVLNNYWCAIKQRNQTLKQLSELFDDVFAMTFWNSWDIKF